MKVELLLLPVLPSEPNASKTPHSAGNDTFSNGSNQFSNVLFNL